MIPLLAKKPLSRVVQSLVKRDNGCWLDASDMSTMYQDAAGTTPVTAMEQPVGLWLDKSQGLQLGPELVTNGDFSQGVTGWFADNGAVLSIVNGKLRITATNTTDATFLRCYGPSASSSSYVMKLDINRSRQSQYVSTYLYGSGPVEITTTNQVVQQGTAGFTEVVALWFIALAVGDYIELDNISVRELKGNHATQSITGYRPVISARKNLLLATDTLSTQSVPTVAAKQTLSFTGTGSVTLSGTATGTLAGTGANNRVSMSFTPTAGTLTLTVSGDARLGQLEYGPTATTYQKVNTPTDYDTAGFPRYLRGDGVDDYLNLPFLNLYANGSATVISAVSMLRQSANACVVSEGNSADNDSLYCMARQLASGGNLDSVIIRDDATTLLDTTGSASALADGVTAIRGSIDTGSNVKLFKNGHQLSSDDYTRSGTVTLNNTTIGAKVGTTVSMFNNMQLYGLIITKSPLSDADRRKCEVYLSRKAGVQL